MTLWKMAVVAGLAAVGVVAFTAWRSSYAVTGPSSIRITQKQIGRTVIEHGKVGRSVGDVEITRALLYNKRITPRAIGHGEVVCTYTDASNRSCTGTFVLPKGKIVVGGSVLFTQLFQLAVLGGTDLYNNARGTLTVTTISKKPQQDVLLFRLVA
jgi:hypothetical protein